MADITIAEFNGNGWLVGGEEHIDGLLANMLEDDVSIEFISCDSLEAIRALWRQNCRPGDSGGDMSNPWLIHPAIITRTRRKAPDHAVFFAQWSAQIDQHAAAVIRAAAWSPRRTRSSRCRLRNTWMIHVRAPWPTCRGCAPGWWRMR